MFHIINGVQIREYEETKMKPSILDKRFEIEYQDNVYLNKVVCLDLINLEVQGYERKFGFKHKKEYGRHWLMVVKHKDYVENKPKYGEVCCIVQDKIADYLILKYGYKRERVLIDCMESVYGTV